MDLRSHTYKQSLSLFAISDLLSSNKNFNLSVCTHPILSSSALRFGDDIPGMEGLGTDITVVCPWEAFGDMELSDLAKYGIV